MKPKQNYKPGPMDNCQTPPYAVEVLFPYLFKDWTIWECAEGKGNITKTLRVAGYEVIGTDIQWGVDFFECEEEILTLIDAIVTNPPFSLKYRWLERCLSFHKPFALLVPVEMIGAQRAIKALNCQDFELLIPDRRINFEMPNKGYDGNGAQFPTMWLTWGLGIGSRLSFFHLEGGCLEA